MLDGPNLKSTRTLVVASLALALLPAPALAQPAGEGPVRVVAIQDPNSEDLKGAREFVAVMYHGESDADTADRLSERLMDRYRRAFDLFDGVDDPAVQAAKMDFLKSLPSRVHSIVDPRVPALRAAAISTFAMQWRGDEMRALLAFARTPGGKRYVEDFPVLDQGNHLLRPVLVPLVRDDMELANAMVRDLSHRLGAKFTDHPEYAQAIIAAASDI